MEKISIEQLNNELNIYNGISNLMKFSIVVVVLLVILAIILGIIITSSKINKDIDGDTEHLGCALQVMAIPVGCIVIACLFSIFNVEINDRCSGHVGKYETVKYWEESKYNFEDVKKELEDNNALEIKYCEEKVINIENKEVELPCLVKYEVYNNISNDNKECVYIYYNTIKEVGKHELKR